MTGFIKNSSFFVLNCVIISLLGHYSSSYLLAKKASFEIEHEVKHIILGHSHPECAYNDSLIDQFRNVSISGESYFYTLPKLKQLIKANQGIETVFLEFTNNQISSDIDSWIWDQKYLSYHYLIYAPYIERKDNFFILKNRPKNFIANLPIVFKNNLKKGIGGAVYNIPNEYGGYQYLTGNLYEYQEKIAAADQGKEDFVEINKQISQAQIDYLKACITFLKEKNINYCLIRSPQHSSYTGSSNELEYQKILSTHFESDPYLDLNNFPLNEEHFRDPEHLNFKGAKIISLWLNDMIGSGVLIDGEKRFNHLSLEKNL